MALRQAAFRFYADTGTESTLTPLANLNVGISKQDGDQSTFLIRFLIQSDGGTVAANTAPQFERNINGGAWGSITTTSTIVKAVATSVFANAANTTSQLGGTGAFDASNQGCTTDGLSGGSQMDIAANGHNETICAVQLVAADVQPGDTVGIRITTTPTAITIWDQNATVSITANIQSGVGTASGAGTAAGVGLARSISSGVGTAAGAGTASALGVNVLSGSGTAAGAGTASAPGVEILSGVGTATGVGAATGEGATVGGGTIEQGAGTAVGVGAASAAGAVLQFYLPNVVIAATNLQDTSLNSPPTDLADIMDNPASPDANWYTAPNPAANTMLHLGFFSPDGNLISGQSYPIRVRKTAGAGNPTVTVDLYEAGAFVATLVGPQVVTAGAPDGEEILVPWDASLLANPSGVNAEIKITGTAT